jgi:GH18 family chitinase
MSRRIALSTLVALAVALPATAAEFRVIGYMPSWSGSNATVQYDKLTIINYAFANPNSNGTLKPIDNTAKLTDLVSRAHAQNVKVVLSLGGWNDGNDSAFESLAGNSTARTTFVNACVNVANQYNLDGIDIDWEYPDPGTSATNYGLMMNQLCTAMHQRGKTCSAAVISSGSQGGGVPSSVFSYIDYIMLMAYDGGAGSQNSPYSLAVSSMDYWLGRGLPASKCVLGVPFYGRGSSFDQYRLYNEIVALDPTAPNKDMSNGYGYNGIQTIKNKTTLAMQRGGGIMNWELSGDTTGSSSLMLAIDQVVKAGGTPRPTPTPTSTPTPTVTPTPTPVGNFIEVTPGASMVTASTSDANVPGNTVDNSLATRWSGNGDGAWIKYDLGSIRTVAFVKVAVYQGNARRNRFDIQTSTDNATWTTRLANVQSSGTTTAEETYDIADVSARWVRYLGHGNTGASIPTMNSVTEVSVFAPQMPCPTETPISMPAPTGLFATGAGTTIQLSWRSGTNGSGAHEYEVHRSTTAGSGYAKLATVNTSGTPDAGYTDTAVVQGTTYYYRVNEIFSWTSGIPPCPVQNHRVPGPMSNEASASTGGTPPTPTPTPTTTATPTATVPPTYTEVTPAGSAVTASTNDGNVPANTVDNNFGTRWSGSGDGAWLQLDLGTARTIGHVNVAAYQGNLRRNRFDIQVSSGGGVWTTVRAGAQMSGTTTAEETFDFDDVSARWVRYVGHGATINAGGTSTWNSVTEVSVFALP